MLLIDNENTPNHQTHASGKDADIRSVNLSSTEQKIFLQLCVDNPGVTQVLFGTDHGISSNKIVVRADHADHFHVDFA